MVLHNILIIGLTWVITTVVLGIIYAIIFDKTNGI